MTTDFIGWRSLLFVPATNERFVTSALRTDTDAIQLDLEDSITAEQKDTARDAVGGAIQRIAGQGRDVVVRVNHLAGQRDKDLAAVVQPGLTAITLPKVEATASVEEADTKLRNLEAQRDLATGTVRLIAMIETARGLLNAASIADSADRLVAITIGPEDLALSLGSAVTEDALYHPTMTVLTAARAADKIPLGYIGSMSEYKDLEKYRQWIRRARQLGFEGAFCIHPTQVPILNEEFLPSATELARARALVSAFEVHVGKGEAAFTFEGEMVDAPIALRARQLIQRAERRRPKDTS